MKCSQSLTFAEGGYDIGDVRLVGAQRPRSEVMLVAGGDALSSRGKPVT